MMFAWTNSYNKQVRFKCGVGAYVNKTGTVMVCGDMGSWSRKHTGTADTETQETIDEQVANAHMYYDQLCADKASMESITMNKRKQAQMLGILFAEYQILTTEQASIIRDQMKRPSHVYSDSNSLWAFYNYVTIALQQSHPKTWMEDQRILHMFISEVNKFAPVSAPVPLYVATPIVTESEFVDPNQINLLDAIAQAELEKESGTKEHENEEVLYQSEEIILSAIEAEEVPLELDEDDDAVLGSLLTPCAAHDVETEKEEARIDISDLEGEYTLDEMPAVIETIQERIDEAKSVVYTDPAGNTFEAPIVIDDFAEEDNFDLDFTETEEETGEVPDFF
jgi:hypothetical protein